MKTTTLNKTALVILLVVIQSVMFSNPGKPFWQRSIDPANCLELEGKMERSINNSKGSYTVSLIYDNTPIQSKVISEGRTFKFSLKENAWYAIEIKKEGCVSKIISVNTAVPQESADNVHYKVNYKLTFEVGEPLKHSEAKYFNEDVIDFPVAIVTFDKTKEAFYVNEQYFSNIRKSLKESLIAQQ